MKALRVRRRAIPKPDCFRREFLTRPYESEAKVSPPGGLGRGRILSARSKCTLMRLRHAMCPRWVAIRVPTPRAPT